MDSDSPAPTDLTTGPDGSRGEATTAGPPRDPKTGYRLGPENTSKFPPGIAYIVGNECAERFSFYGMKAILAVFMTEHLMKWGSDEKAVVSEGTATEWVHTFVLAAYAFPIIGAIVSDWFLGKYKTILYLSVLYCFGHLALALDESRVGLFTGLALIAVGTGAIKPCVSAHVGDQFGSRNKHLLSKVFFWFYFSINLGSAVSTILTPILLTQYGPSVAFGVPGVLMAVATLLFWMGRKEFAHVPPGGKEFLKESFSGVGLKALLNLVPIYALVAVFWALFDQTASKWVFQAKSMDLEIAGTELLPSQLQAANPIMVMALIPLMAYGLYPVLHRLLGGDPHDLREPKEKPFLKRGLTPLRKIGIGFLLTAGAFAVSALIEENITGGRVVPYAMQADDGLTTAGTADSDLYRVENVLDGETAGRGWISGELERSADGDFEPEIFVVRLRERRAWELERVEIDATVDPTAYYETKEDDREEGDPPVEVLPAEAFAAREVELLTGESSKGPWSSAGTIVVPEGAATAGIDLPAGTSTEYLMLRVTQNNGGPAVGLGEVRALAAGSSPGADVGNVWPNVAATGYRPNLVWQLLAYLILTAGEVMVSITCLEFSYTQAPNRMKSLVMSVYLLSVASGNFIVVLVNLFINNPDGTSKLPGADYYWFFTGLMLAATLVYLVVAKLYSGRTYVQDERDLQEDHNRGGIDATIADA
ncbi:POT family MFS transporter [Alienimonas californiensis]|uniref:Putative dipeptide and tripeptide permease YjdL n=1 Tax=Alienimonas californiensis TaxID=2527989 RepID=A0A517P8F1_9PLAN|nr:POT family MFS transporter [Alienimonas californiensis]QDT15635.1 putative dipeptide and tripeptide permease YjdL [Alienimonas californiensis]